MMYVRIFSPYAGLCLNQVLHHHGIKNSRGREPLFCKIPMSSSHPHALGHISSVQFSSVAQLCLTLCNTMDCSIPGLLVHHQLPKLTQTHVDLVRDAIQTSHPLWSPSRPAFNLSQHQGLSQWVSSLHQVAKVLECQLQQQSFQWIFRTDFL